MKRRVCVALVVMLWAADARAQFEIDGSVDAAYGAALSVQDTRTGYGDGPVGGNPDPVITGGNFAVNGGSELDQVFGAVHEGRLYVMIAGNLEENFNKLHIFIDSAAGGVNKVQGNMLPGGFDGFCCGGFPPPEGNNTTNTGAFQRMNGLEFDAGFDADYALIFTHGREAVATNKGDFNSDGKFDAGDYVRWRNNLGAVNESSIGNNGDGGGVGLGDYALWKQNYGTRERSEFWAFSAHFADMTQGTAGTVRSLGMQLAPRGEPRVLRPAGADALGDYAHVPQGNPGNTDSLLSSYTLAGLNQGELIDRAYALSSGGCVDDSGKGCLAREFEFALDVDPLEINVGSLNNMSNHRNFSNIVDLRMALDNSNIAGVRGGSGTDWSQNALVEGEDDPAAVTTGIEFSIPLAHIGNPTGDIRLLAFIGGGNLDHMSNQVSGDGVYDATAETGANIGGDFYGASPLGSFKDIPGNQYVTIVQVVNGSGGLSTVPEPTTAAFALGAVLVVTMVRRRGK